jgi:predicted metallopeptidase
MRLLIKSLYTVLEKNPKYEFEIVYERKITNNTNKKMIVPFETMYVPEEIHQYIKSSTISTHNYIVRIFNGVINTTVDLVIHIPREHNLLKKEQLKNLRMCKKIINAIVLYVQIMKQVFGKELTDLAVSVLLSDIKKNVPTTVLKSGFPIKPVHINSGVSLHSNTYNSIFVFRKDEALKVLFHEMMHIYGTHPLQYSSNVDNVLKEMYNIKNTNSLHVYEAYVEATSVITNTVVYSYVNNTKRNKRRVNATYSKFLKCVQHNLGKELVHQRDLINHIMFTLNGKPIHEETNAFSYYFIKHFIVKHFNKFEKIILDKNSCIKLNSYKAFFDFIIEYVKLPTRFSKNNRALPCFKMTILNLSTQNIFKSKYSYIL